MQQETAWELEQARSQGMARPQETMQEVSVTDAAVAIATQHVRAAQGADANHGQGQRQRQIRAKDSANPLDKPPTHSPSTAAPQGVTPQGVNQRANQQAAQKPVGGNAASGLSPSTGVKQPAIAKAQRSSLTPPPPPSEIARVAAAGALEQPELVTTRIARTDIVEVLITDLQGADPAKRRKAIWELGQRSDSRAIQPLVNMMVNSDSRQRSLILAALSEIGTQTLKPMKQALAMSLQDENAEVRKNAIRDLTRIYDLVAQISHLLQAALEDPDPEVQDTARWALKQLNRIRSNAGLEGSQPQQMLQQSVSPPEILSED